MESEGSDRLQYLLTCSANLLPKSCHKLRSYLNIHMKDVADQYNLQCFKFLSNRNKTCPYCCSPWSSETTSFKLLPSKKRKFKSKNAKPQEETNKTELNSSSNTLFFKCKVCTKKSLFCLTKLKKTKEEKKNNVTDVGKKKKKRKKDKSCGLTMSLKQSDPVSPEVVFLKKTKSQEHIKKRKFTNPVHSSDVKLESPYVSPLPIRKKNTQGNTSNKLARNPFAIQPLNKPNGKKDKKLQRLKDAIKKDQTPTRKYLKDFLTLV